MRRGRTFDEESSGSSAVEFALLLPVLVTIVFGIIEFGLIIFHAQYSRERST
ncbi:TadE family protein [Methylobacterium oryzae CBMB20]